MTENSGEIASYYLPDRDVSPKDYKRYDGIEIVHLKINCDEGNPREKLIRERLKMLIKSGVSVEEVDIETNVKKGKKVVIGGALGDVCAQHRRTFIKEHGGQAVIDSALTTDF